MDRLDQEKLLSLIDTARSPGLSAHSRNVAFEALYLEYGGVARNVLKRILRGSFNTLGITTDDLNLMSMDAVYAALKDCDPSMTEKFPGLVKFKALSIARDTLRHNRLISIPARIQEELASVFFDIGDSDDANLRAGFNAISVDQIGEDFDLSDTQLLYDITPEELLLFFELAGIISSDARQLLEASLFPDHNTNFKEILQAVAKKDSVSEAAIYRRVTADGKRVVDNIGLMLDLLLAPVPAKEERFLFGSLASYLLHQFSFKPKETTRLAEHIFSAFEEDHENNKVHEMRLVLSIMYRRQKHFDKAKKILQGVEDSITHRAEAFSQLGEIAFRTNLMEEAGLYFRRALEADPKTFGRNTALAKVLIRKSDFEGATKHLRAELELNPSDKVARYLLAKAHFKSAQYELFPEIQIDTYKEALKSIDELIHENPKDYRNHILRFDILFKLGRYKDAKESLDKASINAPDRPEIHTRYARFYLRIGKLAEARESAIRAYGLDPRNPIASSLLEKIESKLQ